MISVDHSRSAWRIRRLLSSPASMKPSESVFVPVRGLRYHCRCWGDARAPKLFMLHGWMDVSASVEFVEDALRDVGRVSGLDLAGARLRQVANGRGRRVA